MTQEEFDAIIAELKDAGPVLKLAIEIYNTMPEGEKKKRLAEAIKAAKADLIKLDVILENLQLDLEYEQVEKDLDKLDKTLYN